MELRGTPGTKTPKNEIPTTTHLRSSGLPVVLREASVPGSLKRTDLSLPGLPEDCKKSLQIKPSPPPPPHFSCLQVRRGKVWTYDRKKGELGVAFINS